MTDSSVTNYGPLVAFDPVFLSGILHNHVVRPFSVGSFDQDSIQPPTLLALEQVSRLDLIHVEFQSNYLHQNYVETQLIFKRPVPTAREPQNFTLGSNP